MKHTPTPWALEDAHVNDPHRRIHGADSVETVAMDVRPANAAFIVLACNAHDELVAALEQIANDQTYSQYPDGGKVYQTIARAALAKVQPAKVTPHKLGPADPICPSHRYGG